MLDSATRSKIVDELFDVYETRKPLRRLTGTYPGLTVEDSYLVQEEFVRRKVDAGAKVKGYKVGLTSKPMQEMAGSSEPDFSAITDDMFLPEATPIDASRFFRPMIEIEIAFVMKHALKGPGVLPVDVIRATDFVVPAIEIVDFRVMPEPGFGMIDTVADLAACGAVVLGANPRRLDAIDVRRVHGELKLNGKLEVEGDASAVLGNPVTSVAWLANKLGQFGVVFEPGQVVLTGSFVRAIPVKAGDDVLCRFDQGLGDLSMSFT